MRGDRGSHQVKQIEELLRQDEFNQHKCLYDLHAAAWLVAHSQGDVTLLRKSAKQMLYHLKRMYALANVERGKQHPTHSRAFFSEAGFPSPGN